jgi:hypothetical protein
LTGSSMRSTRGVERFVNEFIPRAIHGSASEIIHRVTFASCVSGALASLWFVSHAVSPSAVRADASLVRDAGIGFVRVAGCHRAA